MNMKKISTILGICAIVILVLSVPAVPLFGANAGAILRWSGVAAGAGCFILHGLSSRKSE